MSEQIQDMATQRGCADQKSLGLLAEDLSVTLISPDGRFTLRVDHLALAPGQVMALTGESGTGKTMLLELLGLMRAPTRSTQAPARYVWHTADGSIDLAGLWKPGSRSRRLARIRGQLFGFVPQTGGLLPYLRVYENVALPQHLTGKPNLDVVDSLLERLDLAKLAQALPGQLSVGQRQRVAIARALAHRPAVVIADEPTAALDPENSDKVLQLLLETARLANAAVLLSSHEIDRLDRFALPRCALLSDRQTGNTTSVLDTRANQVSA